jgi:hypothetical protein
VRYDDADVRVVEHAQSRATAVDDRARRGALVAGGDVEGPIRPWPLHLAARRAAQWAVVRAIAGRVGVEEERDPAREVVDRAP